MQRRRGVRDADSVTRMFVCSLGTQMREDGANVTLIPVVTLAAQPAETATITPGYDGFLQLASPGRMLARNGIPVRDFFVGELETISLVNLCVMSHLQTQ